MNSGILMVGVVGGAEVAGKSSRGCLWSLQRVYAGVIDDRRLNTSISGDMPIHQNVSCTKRQNALAYTSFPAGTRCSGIAFCIEMVGGFDDLPC